MGDIFNEQLVKKLPDGADFLKKAGVGLAAIALMTLGFLYAGVMSILIIIGVGVGLYFAYKEFDVEYEYVLTNDTLDIDKIIARERRKKVLSDVKVTDFDFICPMDGAHAADCARYARLKTTDVSSSKKSPRRWLAVWRRDGESRALIFEPNEKMLEGMKSLIPRKFPR